MPALTFLVKSICLKTNTAVGHMVFHEAGGGEPAKSEFRLIQMPSSPG